jgi:thiol-disulfide isomerase/thioredoxin
MMNNPLALGAPIPEFKNLPAVGGRAYGWEDFKNLKILVVVFSCNHCPYVQAYEDRMIALQRDYASKGLQLVAINSNETAHYPEDNFSEMVTRAMTKGFNFPYLRDEDQSAADAFGATHTPEFFVFAMRGGEARQRLEYHGRMDDNYQNPAQVSRHYVREAIDALLAGKRVGETETHSIGCTIKWK